MTRPEYNTVDQMIRARAGDPNPGVVFEDQRFTWAEHVEKSAARAALLASIDPTPVPHIGFLMDNIPELSFWLGAGAVSGAPLVGINPTRQGAELARDIAYTNCSTIVTETRWLALLEGLDLEIDRDRILVVDDHGTYDERLRPHLGAALPDGLVTEDALALLIFTSGTSGTPKAVITSQGRWSRTGKVISMVQELTSDDVGYMAMPMFHSNALFAGWSPMVYIGGTLALRRKFSASGFLPDVRRFRATYFNYVGKPLTYILATPEAPDDQDHPLRRVFGNEAADRDIARFADRFGVKVTDSYGSTESGATVGRVPDMPPGSLGRAPEGTMILDAETLEEKARARFDANGRLLNAEECIGEIVNKNIGQAFEGYYNNPEANAERMRHGWYWSGDLGYRDEAGWFYFAGRDFEWLRVDGENFSAAPVEAIVARFPGVILNGVYAVPDEEVGDQVMVAIQVADVDSFDAVGFDEFLASQSDLGTKWKPRFVRVTTELPITHTSKVLKRQLRGQRWECDDDVYWRPEKGETLVAMTTSDVARLRKAFADRGRLGELDKI